MGSVSLEMGHCINGYQLRTWNDIVFDDWMTLIGHITGKRHAAIDGSTLSIGSTVAVSR